MPTDVIRVRRNTSEYGLDVVSDLILLCLELLRGVIAVPVRLALRDEFLEVALIVLHLLQRIVAAHDRTLTLIS